MTAFTMDLAHRLADGAFRFRPHRFSNSPEEQKKMGKAHRPLLGKEQSLLNALREAEERYREWSGEIRALKAMRRSDDQLRRDCDTLLGHLQQARLCLSHFGNASRDGVDAIASGVGFDFSKLQSVLRRATYIAKVGSEDPLSQDGQRLRMKPSKRRGRKLNIGRNYVELIPLEEFAKVLKSFWVRETDQSFSFEAQLATWRRPIDREPTSAAARLLYDAGRILEPRLEVGHIEHIMRNIKHNPAFRTELLVDVFVD
jgi:hypothetical protein